MDSVVKAILASGRLDLAILLVVCAALVGVILVMHKANREDRAESLKVISALTQMLNDWRHDLLRMRK